MAPIRHDDYRIASPMFAQKYRMYEIWKKKRLEKKDIPREFHVAGPITTRIPNPNRKRRVKRRSTTTTLPTTTTMPTTTRRLRRRRIRPTTPRPRRTPRSWEDEFIENYLLEPPYS